MEIEQYAYLKLTSNEHLIYETDKILTIFEENHWVNWVNVQAATRGIRSIQENLARLLFWLFALHVESPLSTPRN